MARITVLQKIGADLQQGEESVIRMRQDEISTAQQQIRMLEKAAQAAQDKRDEAKELRVSRRFAFAFEIDAVRVRSSATS
jgi:hypothetical protein